MSRLNVAGRHVWIMAKGYAPDEGGMQTYAQGLAEAYARAGAVVTVFTQTSAGPRRAPVGSAVLVDIGAGKSPLVPFRFMQALRREMRRSGRPVLVHGTTWRTSIIPMALRLPYVTTFHGREFMYPSGPLLAMMRNVARKAARTIAVSEYSADRLRQRLGRGTREPLVAWNGLSERGHELIGDSATGTRRIDAPASDVPLIFSLCRLEPRKNISACVRACAQLHAAGHRFRYVIAGRGPELAHIRALVTQFGLEDLVAVPGYVSEADAAVLYRDAEIFLHPQLAMDEGRDFEGFGIVIADAMAAGMAVVIGKDGGSPELVEDGVSGLVVDGTDDEALTDAIARLLNDPDGRAAMAGKAAERAARHFTWDSHVATILGAIDLT